MKITSISLEALSAIAQKISIGLENAAELVDTIDAAETYAIHLDVSSNALLAAPIPVWESPDDPRSELKRWTGEDPVALPQSFVDARTYMGLYDITLETEEESIELSFHGDALQDMDGDLSDSDIEKIKNVLNPESIFQLASEVITACAG